jgi:hypothetical protein
MIQLLYDVSFDAQTLHFVRRSLLHRNIARRLFVHEKEAQRKTLKSA